MKEGNISLFYDNLEIITLRFNDPDTVFVIKRDRRFNDEPLSIYLEEDPGIIIEYSADGLETNYESLNVEKIKWE